MSPADMGPTAERQVGFARPLDLSGGHAALPRARPSPRSGVRSDAVAGTQSPQTRATSETPSRSAPEATRSGGNRSQARPPRDRGHRGGPKAERGQPRKESR